MIEGKSVLPYYGWFVLAAGAVSEMLVQGATSYGAGLFVLPVQAEFGLSRADASSSVLFLFIGMCFLSPISGRILDRTAIHRAVAAGAICFSLALALIAWTSLIWVMVLALLFPLALGFGLTGPMMTATMASRWFFRRRGLALGIAAVATSGGGIVVVPLLSLAIQAQGWRTALLEEAGLFFLLVMALALLVLRNDPVSAGYGGHPENKGRSDNGRFKTGEKESAGTRTLPWRSIVGNAAFWGPSLVLATISGISQAIIVSMPAYGNQLGFAATSSALLVSAFSIAAALTKVLSGVMADVWNKRVLLFATALFMPLALGLLSMTADYGVVLAACAMAGIALGGALPLSSALIAARFGGGRFGSVIGWTYALIALFTILAVRLAGSMFDLSGSYHFAFIGLFLVAAAFLLLSLAVDLRSPAAATEPFL